MRPVIVSHRGGFAGSNQVVASMIRHRPADVEPLCVFLSDGPVAVAARAAGVETLVLEAGRARHAWRTPGVVGRLARAARAHGADGFLSHVAKAQIFGGGAAGLLRLPAVWYQHELPGEPAGLQRLAARVRCDLVLANSSFTAARHRALWPGAEVVVAYPGVAAGPETPVARHERARGARLLLVSRLQRWKRVELAIRAMPAVLARDRDATLTVMGSVPPGADRLYPAELERLAAELGVERSVALAGHVEDAAGRMADFDVLVHVSHREPFGLVAAEALARGVPVVAPADGGTGEVVRDRVDGRLVDPADGDGLAAAVLELAGDPMLRRKMGAAGRERVIAEFAEPRTAAHAWREVRRVMGSRTRALAEVPVS